MGRPPKPPEERTIAQTSVRLTAEEKEQLGRLEAKLEASTADVIRRAIAELYERVFSKRGKRGQ